MSNEAKKLTQSANEVFEEIDPNGRIIKARKPSALKRFRFVAMLGKSADSDRFMSMVGALVYLYAIDDDSDIPLNTPREMEALIQRLGDEGLETLNKLVSENIIAENTDDEDKKKIKE